MNTTYHRLIEHLNASGTPFEEITHAPAASAEEYSRTVGSALADQAKTLLLRRYRRAGGKDLVLHSLPGDTRAELDALAGPLDAKRLRLATADELDASTGRGFGELPPVGSIFDLPLSLDERLLARDRIFFNAGRLDRSVVLNPKDLCSLERPTIISLA